MKAYLKNKSFCGLVLLIFLNILAWAPFFVKGSYHIGLGHDSQIYEPAINSIFWRANLPWDPVLRIFEARTDIFSFPGWSVLYPFRWALYFGEFLAYKELLLVTLAVVIIHQILASVTFFFLLRGLYCRPWLAAFGGMSYAYCLYLKDWSSWLAGFSGYAWLPLALLGVVTILLRHLYILGILLLGTGIGLTALASGPALLYTLILITLFVIALFAVDRTRDSVLKKIGSLISGGLLGGLLSASTLIPVFIRGNEYIRWFSGGSAAGGIKVPYGGTLVSPVDQWGPLHLFLPLDYGNVLGDFFVGVPVIIFAGYLVARSLFWRKFALVLLGGGLYFLLDAMGDATPIHQITYHLPFLQSIRYPVSGGIVTVVCLLVVGFLGFEKFSSDLAQPTACFRRTVGIAVNLSGFLWLAGILWFSGSFRPVFQSGIGFYLLLLAGGGVICSGAFLMSKQRNRLATLVLLALFFPLNTLIVQQKTLTPVDEYLACDEFRTLTEVLSNWRQEAGREARLSVWYDRKQAENSCLGHLNLSDFLLNSVAMAAGWNVGNIYLSPRPEREFELFNRLTHWKAFENLSKLLQGGVTHVLANVPEKNIPNFLTPIGRNGLFTLYSVENSRMATNIVGCLEEVNGKMRIANANGNREIYLGETEKREVFQQYACQSDHKSSPVSLDFYRSSSGSCIEYTSEISNESLLVTDRVLNENWHVEVNNAPVRAIMVDGYRLAVGLKAGKNKVVLTYNPSDFKLSTKATMIGLMIYALLVGYVCLFNKNQLVCPSK